MWEMQALNSVKHATNGSCNGASNGLLNGSSGGGTGGGGGGGGGGGVNSCSPTSLSTTNGNLTTTAATLNGNGCGAGLNGAEMMHCNGNGLESNGVGGSTTTNGTTTTTSSSQDGQNGGHLHSHQQQQQHPQQSHSAHHPHHQHHHQQQQQHQNPHQQFLSSAADVVSAATDMSNLMPVDVNMTSANHFVNSLPTTDIEAQTLAFVESTNAFLHPALRGVKAVSLARKRPLLGGPRSSMNPTKRTVMTLIARARTAQAMHGTRASAPIGEPIQVITSPLILQPQLDLLQSNGSGSQKENILQGA
ncbi:probable serine/threonine-protein kinase MARK-A [Uranotaenia lowii]|uniref:probable serine/threonine-protein kinase MARK-A n=1 Tax=Uranotaenia lowii TaxID=190385 RepID=UPI002478E69B|nr:probable serine/threonine-protein kinase MARK-A [Uranotaenia lowii]